MRKLQTRINEDGSATVHLIIHSTLDDIAKATCIRTEDIAFALNECGLLQFRQGGNPNPEEDAVVLSREMVEKAAERWNPRRAIVLPQHLTF